MWIRAIVTACLTVHTSRRIVDDIRRAHRSHSRVVMHRRTTPIHALILATIVSGCFDDPPRSPIVGSITTTFITPTTSIDRPRDLSNTDLVLYFDTGERFPDDGTFHGDANGGFTTTPVPEGPFVLRIGDDHYEQASERVVVFHEIVVGDPDASPASVATPISLHLTDLASGWAPTDQLVATVTETGSTHPALNLELQPPPTNAATDITSSFDWASEPVALLRPTDHLVVSQLRATRGPDTSSVSTVIESTVITGIDQTGGHATSLTARMFPVLAPPAERPVTLALGALGTTIPANTQWSVELFSSANAVPIGAPITRWSGSTHGESLAAMLPGATAMVSARYERPRTFTTDGGLSLTVLEGTRDVTRLSPGAYTFEPGPALMPVTLDGVEPTDTTISVTSAPPLVLAVDTSVLDDPRSATYTLRGRRIGTDRDFQIHSSDPAILIPVEALLPGSYVFALEATVGTRTTTTVIGKTLIE